MTKYGIPFSNTTLLSKWDQVLTDHPGSYLLWQKYISLRQSNFSNFTVSNCLEVFDDCIDSLSTAKGLDSVVREKNLIRILNQLAAFLSQAGFIEKAIGLYQAMIEFHFFCPPAYAQQSFEQRISLFETFWEKDLPRFGQSGAPGWSNSLFMGKKLFIAFL